MADKAESPAAPGRASPLQVAIIVAVAAVLLNVAFYVLSSSYYADKAASQKLMDPAQLQALLGASRVAFGVFSVGVAAGAFAAVLAPRIVGFGLAGLAAALAAWGAVATAKAGAHVVMPATLVVIAVLLVLLLKAAHGGARSAWAFLVGICSTLAVITLFGVTKVRNATGLGLWYAMVIPGLLTVTTVALAMIGDRYRDRG